MLQGGAGACACGATCGLVQEQQVKMGAAAAAIAWCMITLRTELAVL